MTTTLIGISGSVRAAGGRAAQGRDRRRRRTAP